MNPTRILLAALLLVTAGLVFNQWQMQRALERLRDEATARRDAQPDEAAATPRPMSAVDNLEATLDRTAAQLAAANTQIAQLEQRLRQLESGRPRRLGFTEELGPRSSTPAQGLEGGVTNAIKRAWGPEQAAGPPDTFQAGDISTAWASREQDAGEEWLKLEYERAVDIAEVRVRETHNPGAISKVTAFLANGTELVLWEGTEPPAQAPVEMSFQVPATTIARTIKVSLDTTRVPGWNEIDAVAIVARDGSIQWAQHVTASSTYAQPRGVVRLTEF